MPMTMKMSTTKGGKKDRSMRMSSGGGKTDRSMRNPSKIRNMTGSGMSYGRKK